MYKWWTFPLGQSTGNDGSHLGKSARKKERCRCSSNSTDVLFASNANSIIFSVLVETSFFWDLQLLNFCLLSKQLYVGFYRQCCPQTILGRLFFMFYFSGLCEVTVFFFHRAAPPILHSEWTCLRECFKQDILLCSADYKIIFCLLRLARVPLTWTVIAMARSKFSLGEQCFTFTCSSRFMSCKISYILLLNVSRLILL